MPAILLNVSVNSPSTPFTKPASSEPRAEPLPYWETAIREWNEYWEIHYIGFGCMFAIMTLFSSFCLYRIHRAGKAMTLKRYFFSVCLMVMLFCFTRSLYLLLDPYESHSVLTLPVIVMRILFALGYPCLTSAFSLIHFAFIEVKKIRTIVNRLQNTKFLASVISLHFLIVFVVYIVITFVPKFARLLILCQSILIVWWVILAVCFLYSAWQVSREAHLSRKFTFRRSQGTPKRTVSLSGSTDFATQQPPEAKSNKGVSKNGVLRLTTISVAVACLGLSSAVLELYSLFAVYKLYSSSQKYVSPWPWWSCQTAARFIELLQCLVVAYVIFPTLRLRQ